VKDPWRTSELPKGASPAPPFLKPNQIKKEKGAKKNGEEEKDQMVGMGVGTKT
jgi:hypothetical protein